MRALSLLFFCLAAWVVISPRPAIAQEANGEIDPSSAYDLNLHAGTLLPSRFGVTEMVPGWGARLSLPTDKGVFEISGYSGIGNGAVYRTAAVDYRIDLRMASIAAHVVFGLHADQYDFTSAPTDDYPDGRRAYSAFTGGWHYGGGITQWLAGPLYFRGDFRHRFGPGQVVEVTVGLTYRMPAK